MKVFIVHVQIIVSIMCAYDCGIMWQTQVENEHYFTVGGLIITISLECFIETSPDFPCPFELHIHAQ